MRACVILGVENLHEVSWWFQRQLEYPKTMSTFIIRLAYGQEVIPDLMLQQGKLRVRIGLQV